MYVPRAFVEQSAFESAVQQAAQALSPEVVRIIPEIGDDSNGEPAAFLTVILPDAVFRGDQLGRTANRISWLIVQRLQPREEWGVLPYFSFESQTGWAKLDQPVPA